MRLPAYLRVLNMRVIEKCLVVTFGFDPNKVTQEEIDSLIREQAASK